jgi:hypothetical protein
MPRRVFYSFHYEPDCWRASQVRNIGAIEGNLAASDNDWETITRGGDPAIRRWIDSQLSGRTCTVVLIGAGTGGRKWIDYEIEKSWNDGKGVVGIYIHNLRNRLGLPSPMGANPFTGFNLNGTPLSNIVQAYNPPYTDSKQAYNWVCQNLAAAIDEAVAIRNRY